MKNAATTGLVLLLAATVTVNANDIGFVETFALAPDRAKTLEQLIPGTEEYYYYHCLHYQHTKQYDKVQDLLKAWIKRYGHTGQVEEIRNRQALLDYEKNPTTSLEHIRRQLGLNFNHQKRLLDQPVNLPTKLDQDLIGHDRLAKQAFANGQDLSMFEPSANDFLMAANLDPNRRRHLLARLDRPDYPNMAQMVVDDLRHEHSSGFGSHGIHRRLLLTQLDECLKLMPELIGNTRFVETYLTKLRPSEDIDEQGNRAEKDAYLNRLLTFTRQLPPVHNSLKASILYRRLEFNRQSGVYDKALFLEFLQLPRNVFYVNPLYRDRREFAGLIADLNANFFNSTKFPPVNMDEPLVRDYLMRFLVDAKDATEFADYIESGYLKELLAETKMVNGVGDMEKWFSLLPPSKVQALKDRIDIEFLPTNPIFIGSEDPVSLRVAVKNISTLIVKTYTINTRNYFQRNETPLATDIDLDGLVANTEKTVRYDLPSLRRHIETFDLPHLQKPGAYVVECIGNGISSRALIVKGLLLYTQRIGSAGHVFTVWDERGRKIPDAAIWLAGREFTADKDGEIAIPFSTDPRTQYIVLRNGDFSWPAWFEHQAEGYDLHAGFHVERETLLAGRVARVLVQPVLTANGRPIDVGLMENVALIIQTTDIDGIASVKEVKDFKLLNDKASVYEFKVPERLQSITFTLRGKVQNISQGKKQDLSASESTQLNGIDATDKTENLCLRHVGGQYQLLLLGKTGEPRPDRPILLTLRHRDFVQPVQVSLKTTPDGTVDLGELKGIASISAQSPEGVVQIWHPAWDGCSYQRVLHARVGEPIQVPWMAAPFTKTLEAVSLLEVRDNVFVRDCRDSLSLKNGLLTVDDLAAGDYDLFLKRAGVHISLRITAGDLRDGRLVGKDRILEPTPNRPLQVASVESGEKDVTIRLVNTTTATRIHVAATRFVNGDTLFGSQLPDQATSEMVLVRRPPSFYLSGRNMGDEYRYILERKYADKFPGNHLRRPSLLLNPWSLRKTETGAQTAGGPEALRRIYDARSEPEASRVGANHAYGGRMMMSGGFASFDFLPSVSILIENLQPDKDGKVTIPREKLGAGQQIHVLAVNAENCVYREISLPAVPETYKDLRLTRILDPQRHFTEQKKVSILRAGAPFTIDDITTAKFEVYDSLASVHGLFSALSGNATLTEFGFILNWPDLKPAEKQELYSKYACHELNLFLFHKDPAFFRDVIKPYLANKKDKTFVDLWLLDADMTAYLKPWAYGRLNIAERALLGQRLAAEAPHAARHVKDLFDLVPPNVEQFNRLFTTALKGSALELGDRFGYGDAAKRVFLDPAVQESDGKALKFARVSQTPGQPPPPPAMARPPQIMAKLAATTTTADEMKATNVEIMETVDRGWSKDRVRREQMQTFYRALDKTEEWVENNYYKRPIEEQVSGLIGVNGLWKDLAAHDGKAGFLSTSVAESSRNFTEMMIALAVLDLPFKAGEHKTTYKGPTMTLTPANNAIVFHREINEVAAAEKAQVILVSQNFFAADDRYRQVDNERFDKFVTDEFQIGRVYGAQVVLTNPTSTRRKVEALLQIPEGAIAVLKGQQTRSLSLQMEPYSTQTFEYYFYFPAPGKFRHYPVHVAQNETLIGFATPFVFDVKAKLTKVDRESWSYVSQYGTDDEVIAFLQRDNASRLDLNEIAFRMRDKTFFGRTIALLTQRHAYNDTLWSYAIMHNDTVSASEFLKDSPFAQQCGMFIASPLLTIDPVARHVYQHREYWPLVNARVAQLGKTRKILNNQFFEQYTTFLRYLGYRPDLTDDDRMALTVYLLIQDRVTEALANFEKVSVDRIATDLQYDYARAYLAFYRAEPDAAAKIAAKYKDHPVPRWHNLFADVLEKTAELDGKAAAAVTDKDDRDQKQTQLADTAPTLDIKVENRKIAIQYRNLATCAVNLYLMDVELLFSKQPFVQESGSQFSMIQPNAAIDLKLPTGKNVHAVDLPDAFRDRNVMVEVTGAGVTRMQGYYPHSLGIQVMENYGQLRVAHEQTGKALPKVYVKVYARMRGGAVQFYKDGYTDLRGRFDYTSLGTDELDRVERFAVLILSDEHGAVVREAAPPKR
jgi:hypothetical protein